MHVVQQSRLKTSSHLQWLREVRTGEHTLVGALLGGMAGALDLTTIRRQKIIAIVRGASEAELLDLVGALIDGGISLIELTADTPGIAPLLEMVVASYGDSVTIGAGTVTDMERLEAVSETGIEFIVTPNTDTDVIEASRDRGFAIIPGALTPTEIHEAYRAGATAVKLFPAHLGGPGYVHSMGGPLAEVPLIPTGGVNLETARTYLDAGAVAVGIGSALVDLEAAESGAYESITEQARRLTDEVHA